MVRARAISRFFIYLLIGFFLGLAVTSHAQNPRCGRCLHETVRGILDDLSEQGWLGILVTTHSRLAGSVHVVLIQASSPAESSDLREGDKVIAINGEGFDSTNAQATMDDYGRLTEALEPGETARLTVIRDSEEFEIEIVASRYSFWAKRDAVGGELIRRTRLGNYVPSRR